MKDTRNSRISFWRTVAQKSTSRSNNVSGTRDLNSPVLLSPKLAHGWLHYAHGISENHKHYVKAEALIELPTQDFYLLRFRFFRRLKRKRSIQWCKKSYIGIFLLSHLRWREGQWEGTLWKRLISSSLSNPLSSNKSKTLLFFFF